MEKQDRKNSVGLPMTSKWDPERLREEENFLIELSKKPLFERIKGYMKLTGPAWLQSAMTLGAGSAVASVVAGASFGYTLLWVQPVAMFFGIIMLGALANVVLSTGERPYSAFAREIHPVVPFLWALGSILVQ
jgi:Mn2+/Fe2+ NRAMP family transporter